MKFEGKNDEYIEIVDVDSSTSDLLDSCKASELSLLWFKSDNNKLLIDSVEYIFNSNDIISLTEFHKVKPIEINSLRMVKWSRGFYCILDHDSEVSCKGILYYGASKVPVMHPEEDDIDVLHTVMKMFCIEMASRDNLQLEMLQMMLKRLLILCTRIYKAQNYRIEDESNIDIIREYNFLVEQYFKEKHTVNEYAEMLNKSPKTLSNLFRKLGKTTPLAYIQNRILLESRRMLTHSSKSVSEIGHELGFMDIQAFSRFFKGKEGVSPQKFREGKN